MSSSPVTLSKTTALGSDPVPTRSEKYNDESCDCAIVTSDNVEFLIPRYHLQSASSVFREALRNAPKPDDRSSTTTPDRPVISLTDKEFETEYTLNQFFGLLDGSWSIKPTVDTANDDIRDVGLLLKFCDKWDCGAMAQSIVNTLPLFFVLNGPSAGPLTEGFGFAAQHDALGVCELAILTQGLRAGAWAAPEPPIIAEQLEDGWLLDPGCMPLSTAQRIPLKYMSALARAIGQVRGARAMQIPSATDIAQIAEHFTTYVRLWDEATGATPAKTDAKDATPNA